MAERRINRLIADTGKLAKEESDERESERMENEAWLAAGKERGTRDNISFLWTGKTTDVSDRGVKKRALEMAGRSDLILQADEYYITDEANHPGKGTDSKALIIKYGKTAQLKEGQTYFLCLI
jgi:hypothetical protein